MTDWRDPRDEKAASIRTGRMIVPALALMVVIYLVARLLYGLLA